MRKLVIAAIIVAASGPAFAQQPLDKAPPAKDRFEISSEWSTPGHPEGNGNISDGGAGAGGGGGGE